VLWCSSFGTCYWVSTCQCKRSYNSFFFFEMDCTYFRFGMCWVCFVDDCIEWGWISCL